MPMINTHRQRPVRFKRKHNTEWKQKRLSMCDKKIL